MADLFVGPVIEKLIDTGFLYLKDQFRWQTGMKKELERLREKLPQIQAVVDYASGQYQIKDTNPALNKWLWQLRESIDEADDVMDEFEYLKLKKQLTKTEKQRRVRCVMKFINERLVKMVKRAFKIDPTLKRLEEVVHKLDQVSAGVTIFLQLVDKAEHKHEEQQLALYRAREEGALPKNDQIGRDREKEFVINWLSKTSNEDQATARYSNISLLSVVGHGGMGKTTLLQHAYNDESTKQNFALKMWVCVSNNFDVKRVIADMLESATKVRPSLLTLGALQEALESTVNSKKLLLVLDDIWEEENKELNKSKWENVLTSLASGKMGSKILMTTRMECVATILFEVINQKNETLILKGLKDDECLLLLNKYAFANAENLNLYQNLRPIAEKMVKKLSGSPLAARVIGGVLNSRLDEGHWMRVLDYDIGNQDDILLVLKLSYIFLPKILRNCLSFCCTFPQDYAFDKDDLVKIWTSLGFIQPANIPGETMKNVGERYFDNLIRKSLFEKENKYSELYKLHDLIHDMLRTVTAQQHFSIVDDQELLLENSETTRDLFVKTNNSGVLRKVEKFKKLRSFILKYYGGYEDLVVVLTNIFKTSKSIRVMWILAEGLKQIPEEIGHLIHLRYLKIHGTFTKLPVSLSNLYHLMFMDFSSPFRVDNLLPRDLNNLHNLLYLRQFFPGVHEIRKLNSLQELHAFYVQNKNGFRLEELEHMNEFFALTIIFRENLKDAKDAYKAKLYDKRNLIILSLQWDNDSINAVDGLNENVLDNLQPHSSLQQLHIKNYKGVRSAIWMNNVHLISNLVDITLCHCPNLHTLPPFWQLPFLEYLSLQYMPEVKGFDYTFHGIDKVRIFPSLKGLAIVDLQSLENFFLATIAETYDCLFPCLSDLFLENCPNLQLSLSQKLEELYIDNVGWKGSNWLQGISHISIENCANLISLQGHQEMENTEKCQLILSELIINDPSILLTVPLTSVTSIQKLVIEKNDVVLSFPFEIEQWFLQVSSSLCELTFNSLKSLQSLSFSLESFSSLEILCVQEVPLLQLLPSLSTSLKQLKLVKLVSLLSLPFLLESLSLLNILHVEEVPLLQLLPNMPASLEQLELVQLKSLQSLPSSLESLFSLKTLSVEHVPLLQLLPNLPASLENLKLKKLESLQSLPSSLESLSSLKILHVEDVPLLQFLPNMPTSLEQLKLKNFKSIQPLPSSLESLSSLKILHVENVLMLHLLPNMPASMEELKLVKLKSLQPHPSSLEGLSSLEILSVEEVPLLQLLPNMPASLKQLELIKLESMLSLSSSLESLSSLKILDVKDAPLLQLLPNMPASLEKLMLKGLKSLQSLPSSLESLSSLEILCMQDVPLLQLLPNMPVSLKELKLQKLESLQSLPSSLESLSSLEYLVVKDVLLLQLLPNMPISLKLLSLESLESLQCLPSSLSFTSINYLSLRSIPLLQKLPDLFPSMKYLLIINCHPELNERYPYNRDQMYYHKWLLQNGHL